MLTQARLKKLLHYDPETGAFTRLVSTRPRWKVGDRAGSVNEFGHILLRVDGPLYMAHRLAWLYQTGDWPAVEIDHINGVPGDNRWANLREATHSQNLANRGPQSNNTSGFKGVCWDKRRRRWMASIQKDYRHIFLGYFDNPEEAHAAYVAAAKERFGEFARAA